MFANVEIPNIMFLILKIVGRLTIKTYYAITFNYLDVWITKVELVRTVSAETSETRILYVMSRR